MIFLTYHTYCAFLFFAISVYVLNQGIIRAIILHVLMVKGTMLLGPPITIGAVVLGAGAALLLGRNIEFVDVDSLHDAPPPPPPSPPNLYLHRPEPPKRINDRVKWILKNLFQRGWKNGQPGPIFAKPPKYYYYGHPPPPPHFHKPYETFDSHSYISGPPPYITATSFKSYGGKPHSTMYQHEEFKSNHESKPNEYSEYSSEYKEGKPPSNAEEPTPYPGYMSSEDHEQPQGYVDYGTGEYHPTVEHDENPDTGYSGYHKPSHSSDFGPSVEYKPTGQSHTIEHPAKEIVYTQNKSPTRKPSPITKLAETFRKQSAQLAKLTQAIRKPSEQLTKLAEKLPKPSKQIAKLTQRFPKQSAQLVKLVSRFRSLPKQSLQITNTAERFLKQVLMKPKRSVGDKDYKKILAQRSLILGLLEADLEKQNLNLTELQGENLFKLPAFVPLPKETEILIGNLETGTENDAITTLTIPIVNEVSNNKSSTTASFKNVTESVTTTESSKVTQKTITTPKTPNQSPKSAIKAKSGKDKAKPADETENDTLFSSVWDMLSNFDPNDLRVVPDTLAKWWLGTDDSGSQESNEDSGKPSSKSKRSKRNAKTQADDTNKVSTTTNEEDQIKEMTESFVNDVQNLFRLVSFLDISQCLEKLVCDVHSRKNSSTLTNYEANLVSAFRVMDDIIPFKENEDEEDTTTKYRRAARLGSNMLTGTDSQETCEETFSSCSMGSDIIVSLGSIGSSLGN